MNMMPRFLFHATPDAPRLELQRYLSSRFQEIVESTCGWWFNAGCKVVTLLDYQQDKKLHRVLFEEDWKRLITTGEDISAEERIALEESVDLMFQYADVEHIALAYLMNFPEPEKGCLVVIGSSVPLHYYFSDTELEENEQAPIKPRKQVEKQLENELRLWLIASGIEVESQVTTQKHRLDLWIPGIMMLELKAGKVTADDVCQALDYYSCYKKPILLIGSGLTNGASRGLEAINALIGDNSVMFVTWGTVKPYLRSVLNLG